MRAALKRVVQDDDVTAAHVDGVDGRAHRERHRAEMHRHVIALRNRLAVGVVDGAGVVEPLFDIGREPGAAQRDAHLLGDGEVDVLEDLKVDWISGMYAHRSHSPFDQRETPIPAE